MEMIKCEPVQVFEWFDKICKIPHGSGHVKEIADFLMDFAKERGLEAFRDNNNNIIIRKEASKGYESAEMIALQAHMDMVCEKAPDADIDFLTDPICPIVDGDWIRTDGTTLGADDGIGVAMILAVLSDDSLKTPAIEAIITSDEEIGLLGAQSLDGELIKSRKLINLDSEEKDVLICGCAGGQRVHSTIPVTFENTCGNITEIRVSGLEGGHSGTNIVKESANAIVILTRLLQAGLDKGVARLVSFEGGNRETAIPETASMKVLGSRAFVNEIIHLAEDLKEEYSKTDPGMEIKITPAGFASCEALTSYDTIKTGHILMMNPNGPKFRCKDLPDIVETSINMAIVKLSEDGLFIVNSIRSSSPSRMNWYIEKIRSLTELAGGHFERFEAYPGWKYNSDSEVKNLILEAYKELYDEEPLVTAIHAGLECGILSDKVKGGIDSVSMGPQMEGVHSPREKLSISSTEKCYRILIKTLELSK